jgi:LacI family transcriptional regulator
MLGDSDEDPMREDVLAGKLCNQTEGLVLASSRLPEQRIRELAERHHIVLINRDLTGIPRVLIDASAGLRAAVQHLAALGHQHIVYVSGPASSWANTVRRRTVRQTARELDMKVSAIPARRSSYTAGLRSVDAVLARNATAVVAFDDLLAQGILIGLAERGVQVPVHLSVVGCDDVLAATTYPPLTSVSSRGGEAGVAAMDLLVGQLDKHLENNADDRVVIETSLVLRRTTARPPRRRQRR